tara:strand:- start:2487 stop:2708 length:222 start_codon:yes stop_codon:yes gene_type:complete
MIETVIALLMIVNNEIKEHRIQTSMSQCLKGKRVAMRQIKTGSNVRFECLKSKAELELYLGQKHIRKLILSKG